MTLQALTGGRFTLGVGRSVAPLWCSLGLPPMTNAVLVDSVDIVRRLCHGEKVTYDGPAGAYRSLRLGDVPAVAPPPIVLAAIGPNTLELAGRHYDGVILHPFLTVDAVRRSAERVRDAAAEAGRDPAAVQVLATVVVAPELDPDDEAAVVAARAVTYFQIPGFGELLATTNGWDPAPLDRLRAHPKLASLRGSADAVFTREELVEVSGALPAEWLATSSASGSGAECAARARLYLAAGADELILSSTLLNDAPPRGPVPLHEGEDPCSRSSRTFLLIRSSERPTSTSTRSGRGRRGPSAPCTVGSPAPTPGSSSRSRSTGPTPAGPSTPSRVRTPVTKTPSGGRWAT
jgi:probable F420-dependent oxidoreductase